MKLEIEIDEAYIAELVSNGGSAMAVVYNRPRRLGKNERRSRISYNKCTFTLTDTSGAGGTKANMGEEHKQMTI